MRLGVLQALEVLAGVYLIVEGFGSLFIFRDQIMLFQAGRVLRILIGGYLLGHNLFEMAFMRGIKHIQGVR